MTPIPRDVRVGCCGMQMARSAYFQRFCLTEIQQTFYQPPHLKTLERWRAEAPSGFEFTIKAWQLITHSASSPTYRKLRCPVEKSQRELYGSFRLSDPVLAAWRTTRDCARALGARFIIFQCPASFTPIGENVSNLRAFFDAIRGERDGLTCGWEPRGDWPGELIEELTRELDLLYVVDPFIAAPLPDRPLSYFRLHGRPGTNYNSTYTDAELRQLVTWCHGTTYVLFNNIPMVQDARRFLELLTNGLEV